MPAYPPPTTTNCSREARSRRVLAGVGEIELGDDVVADVGGLGEGLHAARVLGQTGDVEGAGDAAGGQHEVVVRLVDDLVR